MAVDFSFGEGKPYGNEQLTSDRDGRLFGAQTGFETLILRFPVRRGVNGMTGGFNQDPAQFFATTFGDTPCAIFLATVVNAGSKT